jgi:hypothetical protein
VARAWPWALVGLFAVAACWASLELETGTLHVSHGNGKLLRPAFRAWLASWSVLGGLAALAFARAWATVDLDGWVRRGTDRAWTVGTALLAFALALAVHLGVNRGLPLIEDESSYRFSAQLLASGRLYAESIEPRAFFDNNFLVNDGRRYTQYFLGWPALLAPFLATGLGALANPLLLAATVPAVQGCIRRLVGSPWDRVGGLLLALSPLAVLGASTHLSHTATMALLAWVAWLATADHARGIRPVALAVVYCWAFFTRPTTTLGVGGPLLVAWLWRHRREPAAIAGFVLPSAAFAGLFLLVNQLQNGAPTLVAYQAYKAYAAANDFAYTTVQRNVDVANFRFDAWRVLGIPLEGLFRLNVASFGWPVGLLFLPLGVRHAAARPFTAAFIGMFAVHCLLEATGMDLFGPVHVFEALLPLVVLTAVGLAQVERWPVLPLVAGLTTAGLLGYVPARLDNMAMNARAQAAVYALADGLERPVVFVRDRRFTRPCQSGTSRVRHNFRPMNHPDLDDPVLWLNDRGREANAALLAQRFGDRTGWMLRWDRTCTPRLEPL